MSSHAQNSVKFKEGFLRWGIITLIALFIVGKCAFGGAATLKHFADKVDSSDEDKILSDGMSTQFNRSDYKNSTFLVSLDTKEQGHQNHFFYVPNLAGKGPVFAVVGSDERDGGLKFTKLLCLYTYPFKTVGTLKGLDDIDTTYNGWGFLFTKGREQEKAQLTKRLIDLGLLKMSEASI